LSNTLPSNEEQEARDSISEEEDIEQQEEEDW